MFRLYKVLRWKELLERTALAERAALERSAEELREGHAELESTRRSFPDEPQRAEDLTAWSCWGAGLRRREAALERRLAALAPRIQEAAERHLAARREAEGIRKLRDRSEAAEAARREKKVQEAMEDACSGRSLPGSGTKFPRSGILTTRAGESTGLEDRDERQQGPNRGART